MTNNIINSISTTMEVEVPFYDVDAMQVVWHGHYAKYMEQARCQLLDLIDYNYNQMTVSGFLWPVVDMRIKYIRPLKFRQKVQVTAHFSDIEYGLKIEFKFRDADSGEKLTIAYTKQVAIDKTTEEMCLLSPPILNAKIQRYLNSRTESK